MDDKQDNSDAKPVTKKVTKKTTVKKAPAKKAPAKKSATVTKAKRPAAVAKVKKPVKEADVVPKARKAVKKTASVKKKTAPITAPAELLEASVRTLSISLDQRQEYIAKAAFLISTKRHSVCSEQDRDWLQAEAVINMIFPVTD